MGHESGGQTVSLNLAENADLKALLDHARSQFQYHAKQRLDSIRYYFIAYGIFATAYFNSFGAHRPIYTAVVALTAGGITAAFWVLDWRNAQMVEIDEDSVIELEAEVARKYSLKEFEAVKKCAKPNQWRRYHNVMKIVFCYLLIISLLAIGAPYI